MLDETPNTPTLADVFEAALAANAPLKCEPGKVTRYDATKQLVDIQPLIKDIVTLEDGSEVARDLPIIPNVPVVFMGGGGFALTFPVRVGDLAVILYAHAALDRWLESDGRKTVNPGDPRNNAHSDAFALVSPATARMPRLQAPTDKVRLGHDSANGAAIKITPTAVEVDNGSGAVALAKLSDLQDLIDFLNGTGLTVAGGGGGIAKGPTTTPTGTTVLKGK